jgi:hypothetical protein
MNRIKPDLLVVTMQKLQRAVDAVSWGQDPQWVNNLHNVLGQSAAAIQQGIQAAESSMEIVGEINPDLQHAPVTERHMESTRAQLISLGEQVHQLRADIRNGCERGDLDTAEIQRRGTEICTAVEKVRHADNDFFQTALNIDLGAGE